MTRSLILFALFWGGLAGLERWVDYDAAYLIGYGAITLAALVIAATFAWLWRVRATPMAVGMALSWSGCAGFVGYWWLFQVIGRTPGTPLDRQALWAFLALYLAGAMGHLRVIAGAYGGGRVLFVATAFGVLTAAVGLVALVA